MRLSVSLMLWFTSEAKSFTLLLRRFSLILSKTTTVSLTEYPTSVRTAFLALAEQAQENALILDGGAPIDRLHREILARVEALLGCTS